ncbi:hypothetical protein D3C72_1572250 [compost metagenome]
MLYTTDVCLSSPLCGEGDHEVVEGASQTEDAESPPPSRRLRRRSTSPFAPRTGRKDKRAQAASDSATNALKQRGPAGPSDSAKKEKGGGAARTVKNV